jgi:uncharacterized protein (TIGR00369 family)
MNNLKRRAGIITSTRERNLQWEDPLASLALAQGLSGLEMLTAVLAGTLPPPPMAILMNLRLVDVSEGRVVLEGEPGDEHSNGLGFVHGGYAMTMLDTALACAIHSILPAGATYGTTDVHARLVRPITKETGTTRCEAHLVSATRTLGTSEGRLTDRNGTLLATATTACALRRPVESIDRRHTNPRSSQ